MLAELRYRLGYCVIRLPALAERREDIPALALRFLHRCPNETQEAGPTRLAPEVLSVLEAAAWPGNVRQLEMVVRDAYLRARRGTMVRLEHLSELVHLPVRFERRGGRAPNAQVGPRAAGAAQSGLDGVAPAPLTAPTTAFSS